MFGLRVAAKLIDHSFDPSQTLCREPRAAEPQPHPHPKPEIRNSNAGEIEVRFRVLEFAWGL
jgi:hypothetical protein